MPRNIICAEPICNRWITTNRLKKGFVYCSKCQRRIDARRKARNKCFNKNVDTKFVNEVKELVGQNKDIELSLSKAGEL